MAAKKPTAKKTSPKTSSKKSSQKKDAGFYAQFFTLVEKRGWFDLTLPEIAKATQTPLSELLERFSDKTDILTSFGRELDVQVASGVEDSDESLKDKLFDVTMRRFDALAPYRGGILRLIADMQSHPVGTILLALETACGMHRSMALMLEMAGLSTSNPRALIASVGLKIVYLSTLRSWKHDETQDLSATMAVLDKGLDRLIRILRLA